MSPPSNDTATVESPIARIALFHGLSAKSLARVASIATEQRYPVGTVLFRAGDVGDRLYLITSWFGGPGVGLEGEVLPQYNGKICFA